MTAAIIPKESNNLYYMNRFLSALILVVCFMCPAAVVSADHVDDVNPLIGTDNHGHVFVGANIPFGAVNVGPNQMGQGWDWCSGYNYPDNTIKGFSMLHLSGTGCADLGDICLMPVVGKVTLRRGKADDPESGFFSTFSHDREVTQPGYYSVFLDRFGVQAEMTSTARTGLFRFTYPDGADARLVFDLENGISDRPLMSGIRKVDDYTVTGFRISSGWASKHYVYFAAVFSQPMSAWQASVNDSVVTAEPLQHPATYGQASFRTKQGEPLLVKVSVSGVSAENALANLKAEMKDWNFDGVKATARRRWLNELNRIDATFHSDRERKAFYTAFYHMMIAPQLFCDVNGDYRGSDGNNHLGAAFRNYTTWSLWDTYRAFHPLATLVFPDLQQDWVQTMLHIHQEQGFLPIWHLMGNETGCMVGISSVPVLADMFLKGFVKEQDKQAVYQAMKATMQRPFRHLDKFNQYGYVPTNMGTEDVSIALEYALNYWSLAQVSKQLGEKADYDAFMKLSQAYRLLYDPATGFLRPKDDKGNFDSAIGFKPNLPNKSFTEGTPWQYLWLVPHDVTGLCELLGGKKIFTARLDSLFTTSSDLGEHYTPDIAGLIGQYAHGNEPSHHVAYLYNYVGCPWKGQARLREIMDTFYGDDHMGLPGNEDVGQMSAWYVLSALGLYQVEPCGGRYVLGSPIVDEARVNVGSGRTLHIIAHNNTPENKYVQKVLFNGKKYTRSYVMYEDLVKGCTLEFFMGSKPSSFGKKAADCPVSF